MSNSILYEHIENSDGMITTAGRHYAVTLSTKP